MSARAMAFAGRRTEAIDLLKQHLSTVPGDTDAQTLLGTVLSWEGYYAAARDQLESVISTNPTHGDALPALINVELWSGRPARARELAQQGLSAQPDDIGLLIQDGRALDALDRRREARQQLDRALRLAPNNDEALRLRRSLRPERLWSSGISYSAERFNDDRTPWQETSLGIGRATPVGTLSARVVWAERFGLRDDQFEVEMYPTFRPGSYAYVAVAVSPDHELFPERRYAADIYQSVGAGFEVSAGVRRLEFADSVHVYTGSISKYYGSWLFTGRTYVTPDALGASRSFHGSFRRYFGSDGVSYFGARYGHGSSREEIRDVTDIEVLDSDVVAGELDASLTPLLGVGLRGSYSREDLTFERELQRFSFSVGLNLRF